MTGLGLKLEVWGVQSEKEWWKYGPLWCSCAADHLVWHNPSVSQTVVCLSGSHWSRRLLRVHLCLLEILTKQINLPRERLIPSSPAQTSVPLRLRATWSRTGEVKMIPVIDRYWFFITDTDYLHVYVPDNRYAEPIFIYCYKVKSILHFGFSFFQFLTTKNCWKLTFFHVKFNLQITTIKTFYL